MNTRFAFRPCSRANLATEIPGSQAVIAKRRRNSALWFGRPLRPPCFSIGSDKVVSITSKMMGITLASVRVAVYNGHRESLTAQVTELEFRLVDASLFARFVESRSQLALREGIFRRCPHSCPD